MRSNHYVTVHLADPPTFGFDEPKGFIEAATLVVQADDESGAAEIAFAIFNSYPEEMHADRFYLPDVVEYRDAGHRSLSVGDEVEVNGTRYRCAPVGFEVAS